MSEEKQQEDAISQPRQQQGLHAGEGMEQEKQQREEEKEEEKEDCLMPEEKLIPITQSLITPTLARLFGIDIVCSLQQQQQQQQQEVAVVEEEKQRGRCSAPSSNLMERREQNISAIPVSKQRSHEIWSSGKDHVWSNGIDHHASSTSPAHPPPPPSVAADSPRLHDSCNGVTAPFPREAHETSNGARMSSLDGERGASSVDLLQAQAAGRQGYRGGVPFNQDWKVQSLNAMSDGDHAAEQAARYMRRIAWEVPEVGVWGQLDAAGGGGGEGDNNNNNKLAALKAQTMSMMDGEFLEDGADSDGDGAGGGAAGGNSLQNSNMGFERENSSASGGEAGSGGGGCGGGGGGGAGAGGAAARTLKRPRLVWTPQLHKRFVDAVSHLGIKNAVPKTIMQLMNVDGLTRENVASHLQKYRLYLRRLSSSSSSPSMNLDNSPSNPASDFHLFAAAAAAAAAAASSSHFNDHQHHHLHLHQQQQQQLVQLPLPLGLNLSSAPPPTAAAAPSSAAKPLYPPPPPPPPPPPAAAAAAAAAGPHPHQQASFPHHFATQLFNNAPAPIPAPPPSQYHIHSRSTSLDHHQQLFMGNHHQHHGEIMGTSASQIKGPTSPPKRILSLFPH